MSREMKIGVGLVILAALGLGVYFQQKKDAAKGTGAAKAELPDFKGTDDVDKIDLIQPKGEVVLEKKGDKWELTKPVSAVANQTNVKSLLDNMKEIKLTEVIAQNPDDTLKGTYELDKDHVLHLVTSKGGEKKLDAYFGKSGGRGNMVMLEGKTDIYAASGYSGWMYARNASDFRDKEMFKFDDANVTAFTITNKNGVFEFQKGDKWTGKFKGKPIAEFDDDKPKTALGAFKNLNAEDFGDGKPTSDTGLDAPEGTVSVTLKDGAHTLKVGHASIAPSHYAQRDADEVIYTIGSYAADWALADVTKFQKAADAGAAPPKGPPGGMQGMQLPPGMQMPPGHP